MELILISAAGLLAWLYLRSNTVTGADGRLYRLAKRGDGDTVDLWRPIPGDGFDYTPDLNWTLGNRDAPPFMNRLAA